MPDFSQSTKLSVTTTLRKIPAPLRGAGIPFEILRKTILGNRYELSIVYTGDTLSQKLNTRRGKTTPTNVLAFPLSAESGELFLNVRKIERELPLVKRTLKEHIGMLAIHGMLHLKGHDHGSTMDRLEKQYGKKYGFLQL